MFIFFSYLS